MGRPPSYEATSENRTVQKTEVSLRTVIDTIPAQVWCANPDGGPAYINRRMAAFLGIPETDWEFGEISLEDQLDTPLSLWRPLLHPEDYETARALWVRALATGEPFRSIHRLRRADGVYRWFTSTGEPIRDERGDITCWYGINIDIDDARRNEQRLLETREELSRAMQVAAIAELSASLAHEINQPLAAILASSQTSQRWMAADPPNIKRVAHSVERIVRDCKAASEIVLRIRALFKRQAPDKVPLDLNEVIQDIARLIRHDIRKRNVKVELELQQALPQVLADRVHVRQLLMNLLLNALDAMSICAVEHNVLTVSTRVTADGSVETSVRDRGCGVPNTEEIFAPFFTTKEKGLGLGLSICRTIAQQHGGNLFATLNPERGTTFTFTLPIQLYGNANDFADQSSPASRSPSKS